MIPFGEEGLILTSPSSVTVSREWLVRISILSAEAIPAGNTISRDSVSNKIDCLAGMANILMFRENDRFLFENFRKSVKPLSTPHLWHTTALLTDRFYFLLLIERSRFCYADRNILATSQDLAMPYSATSLNL